LTTRIVFSTDSETWYAILADDGSFLGRVEYYFFSQKASKYTHTSGRAVEIPRLPFDWYFQLRKYISTVYTRRDLSEKAHELGIMDLSLDVEHFMKLFR
jgi:hypothetical protein